MHPELAPAQHPLLRRKSRIEAIAQRERQIARLQAEQQREVAALFHEDRDGLPEAYVADELALAWSRSRRQARGRLYDALAFTSYPAVVGLVGDGTWLMDHADAVLDELARSGLDMEAREQVLELVLSRTPHGTPYQLRQAVRTAVVVLFPQAAAERAKQAARDRDVTTDSYEPGVAQLLAYGPAADVAAMMASLDALTWPPAPEDTRTAPQRRFDALRDLVCGKAQPGQWQVQVLVGLATLTGEDDLPAELVGHGPVPAPVARQAAASGALRRVVVDEAGRLVAVDSTVHRPDLAVAEARPAFPVEEDEPEVVEPDPDAPSAEDLAWAEEQTDRREVYATEDAARARWQRAARRAPKASSEPAAAAPDLRPSQWSPEGFTRALQRMHSDELVSVDLSTDRYAVPARLKRHLVLRDRTCVFPGCPRPALQCDKDHLEPWPAGPTAEPNLANECEHHHQAKHDRFRVRRLSDGTFRWTTPSGHTYDRPPRPVLDHLQERPPPEDDAG